MSQTPHFFSSQKCIHNGSNKASIDLICFPESLTQTEEYIDLCLKRVKSFLEKSSIEKESRDWFKHIVIGAHLLIFKKHIHTNINDIQVYKFEQYLFAVPNILQNL